MKSKGYILPFIVFCIAFLFTVIAISFQLLQGDHLRGRVSNEQFQREVYLESYIHSYLELDSIEELEALILKSYLVNSRIPELQLDVNSLPIQGKPPKIVLNMKEKETKELTMTVIDQENSSLKVEVDFSLIRREMYEEKPYILIGDQSKKFQEDIKYYMESDPFYDLKFKKKIELREGENYYLQYDNMQWELYLITNEEIEVLDEENKENIGDRKDKVLVMSWIETEPVDIINKGQLEIDNSQKTLMGTIWNQGRIEVKETIKLIGIWVENGELTGAPLVKGIVINSLSNFPGEASYEQKAIIQYGKTLKFLYDLEPIRIKKVPHNYF